MHLRVAKREARDPHDLGVIEKATYLARVAIERDRAEAALRTSEEKYRDLINASPDAICVVDADGKCVLVNPAGVELAGRPEHELIGSSHCRHLRPGRTPPVSGPDREIESGRIFPVRAKILAEKRRGDSGGGFFVGATRPILPGDHQRHQPA